MSSVKATQLRPGMVIQHEGQLFTIFSVDHRTPGNKRGSMQTRMRNLRTGAIIDYRFRAEEFVERAILDADEPRRAGRIRVLPDSQHQGEGGIFRGKSHRRGPTGYHGYEGDPDRTDT